MAGRYVSKKVSLKGCWCVVLCGSACEASFAVCRQGYTQTHMQRGMSAPLGALTAGSAVVLLFTVARTSVPCNGVALQHTYTEEDDMVTDRVN